MQECCRKHTPQWVFTKLRMDVSSSQTRNRTSQLPRSPSCALFLSCVFQELFMETVPSPTLSWGGGVFNFGGKAPRLLWLPPVPAYSWGPTKKIKTGLKLQNHYRWQRFWKRGEEAWRSVLILLETDESRVLQIPSLELFPLDCQPDHH